MEILFLILGGPRKFSKFKFLEVEYKYKLKSKAGNPFLEKNCGRDIEYRLRP